MKRKVHDQVLSEGYIERFLQGLPYKDLLLLTQGLTDRAFLCCFLRVPVTLRPISCTSNPKHDNSKGCDAFVVCRIYDLNPKPLTPQPLNPETLNP